MLGRGPPGTTPVVATPSDRLGAGSSDRGSRPHGCTGGAGAVSDTDRHPRATRRVLRPGFRDRVPLAGGWAGGVAHAAGRRRRAAAPAGLPRLLAAVAGAAGPGRPGPRRPRPARPFRRLAGSGLRPVLLRAPAVLERHLRGRPAVAGPRRRAGRVPGPVGRGDGRHVPAPAVAAVGSRPLGGPGGAARALPVRWVPLGPGGPEPDRGPVPGVRRLRRGA